MNINEVRSIIRQVIAEAMEEGKKKTELPRSSGKLVELKKEMEGLKRMKEALGQFQISESSDQQFVAEYAHMQKFKNEFDKLKEAHARLSEMLDSQISNVDERIKNETDKIKEMMGLIEKAKKPAGKKADKKDDKKEDKKEEPKEEEEYDEEPKPKKKPAVKKDK